MTTYRFARMLTWLEWETEFDPRGGPLTREGSWSTSALAHGLNLDFSRVEFVDFGVLARTLLLVDAAVRHHIPVTVVLPARALTVAEMQHVHQLQMEDPQSADDIRRQLTRRARARGDARAFMRQVGFIDALNTPNWPGDAVRVLDGAKAIVSEQSNETEQGAQTANPDPQDAPYRARRVFSFRWLEPIQGDRLRESDSLHAMAAGLRDLGLSQSDARALSQTVLTELVENVAEPGSSGESEPTLALVGAILLGAETYALRQRDMPEQLGELAECAVADGSQVLRIIVANSGPGLLTRLAPGPDNQGDPSSHTDQAGRSIDGENVIVGAFHKRSPSPHGTEAGHRTTLGLWRVARMVRSYRGSVLVRTAEAMAGVLYGHLVEGTDITEHGLGRAPGTLLEVSILTDPRLQPPSFRPSPRPPADEAPRLPWVNCTFDPVHGIGNGDRRQLEEAAHAANRDPAIAGVVAIITARDADRYYLIGDAMHDALQSVLEIASSIANPAPVVVVFPDADPRILDLGVEGFNAEEPSADASGWASPHSPILVLGADGVPKWCGGPEPVRAVLTALSGADSAQTTDVAQRRWCDAGGDVREFWRALRDQEQLLAVESGQLELRLPLQNVLKALGEAAHHEMQATIVQGGAGVERGLFRGPSLRITNRWIDVDQLLASTIGTNMAAFVLARKVEDALRASQSGRPIAVVQASSTPRTLVSHLSECLSLGGRYRPARGELDIGDPLIGERVPSGAAVVLCTDLISTENTVRRAAASAAGAGAIPLVIACVIDARKERGAIQLLNTVIPIVSLTEAIIDSSSSNTSDASRVTEDGGDAHRSITDIDPILRRPHIPVPTAKARVQEADLLQLLLKDPDSLRLGHIDSPPHRHFSAFIRVDRMLQNDEIRNRITDTVLEIAEDAFGEMHDRGEISQSPDENLEIWHVADSQYGDAGKLAVAVRDRYVARGREVPAIVPVPRAVAGDGWAFPATLHRDSNRARVVIVGWAAATGTTLLQEIRLAASTGARCIVAVSVLNQLGTGEADALGMLRSVAVSFPGTDPTQMAGECRVPVLIRFITISSITSLAAHDCAVCATQERYEVRDEAVPRRLRLHAEKLHDLVRLRSTGEVARDTAADLFKVPISGLDVVEYLRWRGLLLRALRDLGARQKVIDDLKAMTQDPSATARERFSLIRLLAAEQQWLKLPPLRFAKARELLAQACVISLEKSVTEPPWLRLQVLMVLTVAVPEQLADLLSRLVRLVMNEPILLDQIFLDCYRLLLRPPHDSPISITEFRRSLIVCRDFMEQSPDTQDTAITDEYLHVIRELITIAKFRARPQPKTAQVAWDCLREDLVGPVVRHSLEASLLRVRDFVEDLQEVEPTVDSVRRASTDWETCARQLEERALVNLPALTEIIVGEYVSDWLGRKEQQRLLRGPLRSGETALISVTDRLYQLTHMPWQPDAPRWRALREALLNRLNWWNRIFLAAHVPNGDSPALLVDFVRSAPTNLAQRVATVLDTHAIAAAVELPPAGNVSVFCPERLLDELITHLLDNVLRHAIPGVACRVNIGFNRQDPGFVRLIVRNTGTRSRTPPGRGIIALHNKLQPFGGSLVGRKLNDDEWTFAAIATLPLWQGA